MRLHLLRMSDVGRGHGTTPVSWASDEVQRLMPAIAGVANRKKHVSCGKLEGEDAGVIRATLFVNKPVFGILVPLTGPNAVGLLRLDGLRVVDLTRAAHSTSSFRTFF